MTKVYELPNGHRMVADIDESTRVCNITETTLDRLVSELNYYADGKADVLDKIITEIEKYKTDCGTPADIGYFSEANQRTIGAYENCLKIINYWRNEVDKE